MNNSWQPEYFLTQKKNKLDLYFKSFAILQQIKAVNAIPDGVSVDLMATTFIDNESKINRDITNKPAISLKWEHGSDQIDLFICNITKIFKNKKINSNGIMIFSDSTTMD